MDMQQEAVKDYGVRLGDDALILGHRLSEWCGKAPALEEDLALANTALDFIGRSRLFYSHAAELEGNRVSEDTYAYTRDCREFRNLLICELPCGDFAFTMARQYLVDEFYLAFMQGLTFSVEQTLAGVAAKAVKESRYHLRRSRQWMRVLGQGTDESHDRLQTAVNDLWGYTPEMFEPDELERKLVAAGVAVDTSGLKDDWMKAVNKTLAEASVQRPEGNWAVRGGRQGIHTEYLGHLLSELQFVQRAYPGLEW